VRANRTIANSYEKSNPHVFDVAEGGASRGIVNVILEIGRERHRIMETLKAALVRGDDTEALEHARELTGLPSQKSSVPSVTT
jgi:hypothetical protein